MKKKRDFLTSPKIGINQKQTKIKSPLSSLIECIGILHATSNRLKKYK